MCQEQEQVTRKGDGQCRERDGHPRRRGELRDGQQDAVCAPAREHEVALKNVQRIQRIQDNVPKLLVIHHSEPQNKNCNKELKLDELEVAANCEMRT